MCRTGSRRTPTCRTCRSSERLGRTGSRRTPHARAGAAAGHVGRPSPAPDPPRPSPRAHRRRPARPRGGARALGGRALRDVAGRRRRRGAGHHHRRRPAGADAVERRPRPVASTPTSARPSPGSRSSTACPAPPRPPCAPASSSSSPSPADAVPPRAAQPRGGVSARGISRSRHVSATGDEGVESRARHAGPAVRRTAAGTGPRGRFLSNPRRVGTSRDAAKITTRRGGRTGLAPVGGGVYGSHI